MCISDKQNSLYIHWIKILYEVWGGVKQNYLHLIWLGCVAYVHSSQEKVNLRVKKCIFIGYPQGVKEYRVWLLAKDKETVVQDCISTRHAG